MPVDVDASVDNLEGVEDAEGNVQPAANASEQQTTNSLLEAVKTVLQGIRSAVGSSDSLATERYETSGTTAEQLPAGDVKAGGTVLVVALRSNSGSVYVGDDTHQPVTLAESTDAFAAEVSDPSSLWIRTPQAGDGVGVVFET